LELRLLVSNLPLDKDVLNMVVRRGTNSCAYCLRMREEISSGPDDTRQKAEILNKQYHSVFTPECENEELPSLTDNYPSMPEITVTANGIEKLLSKLDPSKATGPDEISSRIQLLSCLSWCFVYNSRIFFVFVLFLNFCHSILYFRDSSSILF
jgi:hypothetical protein